MLKLSDDSDKPVWDDLPEPQIVEITPDPTGPALPPGMEQKIIDDILNEMPEVFRMPEIKKNDHDHGVN